MKNVISINNEPKITNQRFRVKATSYMGSSLSSKWFATKQQAIDWSQKPFGIKDFSIIEQNVVGYYTFEKFGKVFKRPIFETVR